MMMMLNCVIAVLLCGLAFGLQSQEHDGADDFSIMELLQESLDTETRGCGNEHPGNRCSFFTTRDCTEDRGLMCREKCNRCDEALPAKEEKVKVDEGACVNKHPGNRCSFFTTRDCTEDRGLMCRKKCDRCDEAAPATEKKVEVDEGPCKNEWSDKRCATFGEKDCKKSLGERKCKKKCDKCVAE